MQVPASPRRPSLDPHCVQLSSGRYYNPWEFNKRDVSIPDIVSSLSKICRFNGHCDKFYSVAQHSVHVAERVWEVTGKLEAAYAALFHDAAEAYIGDLVQPIKKHHEFDSFRELEGGIMDAVWWKLGAEIYNAATTYSHVIRAADIELLSVEAAHFMRGGGVDWNWGPRRPTFHRVLVALDHVAAAQLFWNYLGEIKELMEEPHV